MTQGPLPVIQPNLWDCPPTCYQSPEKTGLGSINPVARTRPMVSRCPFAFCGTEVGAQTTGNTPCTIDSCTIIPF